MDIIFENVEHRYMPRTPFEKVALTDITITIPAKSFTAIVGKTGSGKSTLVQHINGLLRPSKGAVHVGRHTISANVKKDVLSLLRRKVGMVFQYPEHQLFAETVEKDIAFGPTNFDIAELEIKRTIKKLLPQVGLSEKLLHRPPFELSGGQKRRVAIAGVLATAPSILILDEPTASLDPPGQTQIMELFTDYHRTYKMTTVLVTHRMEDVYKYADHVIVLHEGKVKLTGHPKEIFQESEKLYKYGLNLPQPISFLEKIKGEFQLQSLPHIEDEQEIAAMVAHLIQKKGE